MSKKYEVNLNVLKFRIGKKCPCSVDENEICVCKTFLETGVCKCKLFIPIEEENEK